MKTLRVNILSLAGIMILSWISINGYSQEKLTRQEKKEIRKAQLAENFRIIDSLLTDRSFVLEADNLQDAYGSRIFVLPDLNFVRVQKTSGVLQTGTNSGYGYNAVGGVTAEGSIGSWNVYKDDKRMLFRVQFSLTTQIGHYDVSMVVTSDNHASATITGLGPGRLTWEGHLETTGNSRVFKGMNTI